MITCTVHEPPEAPADRIERAETLVFVKEGFAWPAFLLTPFWAIANRLWLVLLGYLAIVVGAELLFMALGIEQSGAVAAMLLALQLWIGLEAAQLKRWTLARSGWQTRGSVNGRDIDECERRFLDLWLPSQPLIRVGALSPGAGPRDRPIQTLDGTVGAGGWRSAFRRNRGAGETA